MRPRASLLLLAACCLSLPFGCSEPEPLVPVITSADCENLNPMHCLLPWPSGRFLKPDSSRATGRRLALPASGMPANRAGVAVDARLWDRFDGFSPTGPAMTAFDRLLDTSDLPGEERIEKSLEAGSPTVLLDAETGERVAHFSEVDQWQLERKDETLYIRPAARLKEEHRYIVAIRDLRFEDNSPVEPSAYFRALRDNLPTDAAELEGRRAHFEEIFAKLETAGVDRGTLIEAWDFHTASGESLWGDLLQMRDDWLTWSPEGGAAPCTITEVTEDPQDPLVFRLIRGTFKVPLYLTSVKPPTTIARDSAGHPKRNGEADVKFDVVIPRSVRDRVAGGRGPARVMITGVEALGDVSNDTDTQTLAQELELVWAAPDRWGGFTAENAEMLMLVAEDGNNQVPVLARVTQGIVNRLAFRKALTGQCAALDPQLAGAFSIDNMPSYDPAQCYRMTQGHLNSFTVAALDPGIERMVVLYGPAVASLGARRGNTVAAFEILMKTSYPDRVERDLLYVVSQLLHDTYGSATFVPHLLEDPLPGSRTPQLLVPTRRYETNASTLSAEFAARTMGLPLLLPSAYEATPWGVKTTSGPAQSAYVVFDDGLPPIPPGALEPTAGQPYDTLVHCKCFQQQLDAFLRPGGVVTSTCTVCAGAK